MSESQQLPNNQKIPDRSDPPNIEASQEETSYDVDASQTTPADQLLQASEESSSEMAEALAWQSDADVAELVALSEALRHQNTDLMEHVQELETLLEECHTALQLQVKRSENTEAKLAQQSKELQANQEQLTRLFRELEASHQVAQRQQILIETLTDQLQNSQERVAQLERQCALIQQRYNEQSQILLQSETTCSELQDRLRRQQRYTLQFKSALDKCLEMPGFKEELKKEAIGINTPVSQNTTDLQRFSIKPQPIQPWSAKVEATSADADGENSETHLESRPANAEAEERSNSDIDNFVNPFFGAAEPEIIPELALEESTPANTTSDIKTTEEILWAELERLTKEAVSPSDSIDWNTDSQSGSKLPEQLEALAKIEELLVEQEKRSETLLEESDILPAVAIANQPPNWPSPIVYPQRTPKKIKSLAAIDLPSFPRLNKG